MFKMEFLKRKHFSLRIIATLVLVLAGGILDDCTGLQGVPTWICLGLKSPFIEFSNELEVLANNSVPLNITKDEQALMHQEGLRKLGTFIKPVDLRDSATGYVKANLTKKIPSAPPGIQMQRRVHPIQEEMDQKQIILLDEDTDENGLPASLTDEDRKFIVPMALKNASPDPRIPIPTTQRTTTTTRAPTTTRRITMPPTPEFASDIDDLKRHILFLQNLTKHDSNFQSKFVVFPSLQKDKQKPNNGNASPITSTTTTTTVRPIRPFFQYSAPVAPPTRKIPPGMKVVPGGQTFGGYYHNDDEDSISSYLAPPDTETRDKITIVPQVLLLNDQTSLAGKIDPNARRNLGRNTETITLFNTTMTTTTTTTPMSITTTTMNSRRPTKRPPCLRNPNSPKCVKQRKREELQRIRDREQLLLEQRDYFPSLYEPLQTINNTKRFAVSIEIPDSFKKAYNESELPSTPEAIMEEADLQVLSRPIRSHHKRRNIGGGLPGRRTNNNEKFIPKYGSTYYERDAVVMSGGRDFLISNMDQLSMLPNSSSSTPTVSAYSEPIDLNPDNCYLVDGMSYGQKKQCVLHTSLMPAISRGARAAIQECQYQFKNRRWNCSTIDDSTVFGPMTGLGSPEMAFIHALAAATVTSFIARACRDGQLASCGCSRGTRPKQLHDDWTWGGCGDNLEYAYKFATDFIDVREKETRRGTRGAGNPERRRARQFQRRQQQQLQQQQQQQELQSSMQADDARSTVADRRATLTNVNVTAAATAAKSVTTNTTTTTARRMTMTQTVVNGNDTTAKQNEDSKNDNNQQNSNKTVSNDAHGIGVIVGASVSAGVDVGVGTGKGNNMGKDTTAGMYNRVSSLAPPKQEDDASYEQYGNGEARFKQEDLLELQERITKEIFNSKLQEKEMLELQEKINREILNSKVFNTDANKQQQQQQQRKRRRKNQRAVNGNGGGPLHDAAMGYNTNFGGGAGGGGLPAASGVSATVGVGAGVGTVGAGAAGKWRNGIAAKARSLMNLHNNEAGRRAVIKKTRITCKCHGVSGSCSLITCWQQLSSIREIGDYLREKYEEATEVKLNKRGRLQVKDPQFKVPTAHDLVYLDESPDWCRHSRQLQWPGTHGRICNKTSSGLDGCAILCCGRGYNTKNIVVRERCNCKFHWCCQVKCDVCVKVLEEHTCK